MKKILIIGETGMLGHIVYRYFKNKNYNVCGTSRDKLNSYYLDILDDYKRIDTILETGKFDVVINCIGILNKDAENNPDKAILINSFFPHYLDKLSSKYNFKLIHISTDCVFNGKLGEYKEDSIKDATTIYGRSKALGEVINDKNITLRTSIIGPDMNPNGIGLFKWFMNQTGSINGFDKVIWTGVTTLELAKQIEVAINNNICGLFHVVNGSKIDKYSLLNLIKKEFDKDITINKDSSYVSDKSLIVTRKDFVFKVSSYEEMIKEMKKWIIENNDLYKGEYTKGMSL